MPLVCIGINDCLCPSLLQGIKRIRTGALFLCTLMPGIIRGLRTANPAFILLLFMPCNPLSLYSVLSDSRLGTKAENSQLLYYLVVHCLTGGTRGEKTCLLKTNPKSKCLCSVLAYPREGQTLSLQRETFQDESLGTEFSSKSNTPVGLKFKEQEYREGLPPMGRFKD